jgi:hypothetical protein
MVWKSVRCASRSSSRERPAIKRLRSLALAAYVVMFGGFAASSAGAACPTKIDAADRDGLAVVTVVSPCRAGQTVRATLGTLDVSAAINPAGEARIAIPVTAATNQISVTFEDGASEAVDVGFARIDDVLRITLEWDAAVDLDLHIVEPGGRIGGSGHVAAPVFGKEVTLGFLEVTSTGRELAPHFESYVFSRRADAPRETFGVFVEFVTRGQVPQGETCGAGTLARIQFTVTILDRGKLKRQDFEIPPATCGLTLDQRARFVRVQ